VGGLESLSFYVGIIPSFFVCFVTDCLASLQPIVYIPSIVLHLFLQPLEIFVFLFPFIIICYIIFLYLCVISMCLIIFLIEQIIVRV
jgi:hypothetical protein